MLLLFQWILFSASYQEIHAISMLHILSVTTWGMRQWAECQILSPGRKDGREVNYTSKSHWTKAEAFVILMWPEHKHQCHAQKSVPRVSHPNGSAGNEKVNSKILEKWSFKVEKESMYQDSWVDWESSSTSNLWAHGVYTLLICIWVGGLGLFEVSR